MRAEWFIKICGEDEPRLPRIGQGEKYSSSIKFGEVSVAQRWGLSSPGSRSGRGLGVAG